MSDVLAFFSALTWWQVIAIGVTVGLALAMLVTIFRGDR